MHWPAEAGLKAQSLALLPASCLAVDREAQLAPVLATIPVRHSHHCLPHHDEPLPHNYDL